MGAAARPCADHGWIYINDGPAIIYLLTRSCLPSRFVSPGHLNDAEQAAATDAAHSMAALLVADRTVGRPRNQAASSCRADEAKL